MKLSTLLLFALLSISAQAAVTITNTLTVSTLIPDNNPSGYTSTMTITAGANGVPAADEIDKITKVTVELNFDGGYNGDLYVYLVHEETGFSVLLNRIGRTDGVPNGSASSGITITLDDNAVADVHTSAPSSGTFTGTYQPDARDEDPEDVLTSSDRNSFLSSFNNLSATGEWTLFVADSGFGDQSTLQSWTLNITAVPEPSAACLLLATSLLSLRRKR